MTQIFKKALLAYETQQYTDAYKFFEEEAEENPKAMVNMALMHIKGFGCKQNDDIALALFEKAADKGSTHAMYTLGAFYEKGKHTTIDNDKALKYYKDAADNGHIHSQLKAGLLYRQEGNITESMRYLITAAHNKNEQAQSIITYVSNSAEASKRNDIFHSFDEKHQRVLIENILDNKIRPTLTTDGGGIELVNYIPGKTPQIWLNYLGACSGCQLGSTSTADMLLDNFETLIDKNVILYLM